MLLVWFLLPFAMHGWRYPLGPDGPVYLWWTRLAGHDGLSAVPRPGVPAVALTLAGTLRLPLTAVVAALEVSLAVALGLGAWALVRAGGADRVTTFVAGLLTGTYAVHLASGYLATLAFAAAFIAGVVALDRREPRGTIAAAALFAAAAASHPLFSLLGLAILAVACGLSWRKARGDAERIARAVLGAAAVAGAGILALQAGPPPLAVDTSRDGFLRRAGLGDVLRSAYLDRFVQRWTRYVQWVSLPLAIAGWRIPASFVRRVLVAWILVTVIGVAASLATGWLPADRFLTFGFAVPLLAAFGVARAVSWLVPRARVLALAGAAVLTIAMLAGSWIAWARQEPFLDDREVEQVTVANAIARAAPPNTPLVFLVNQADDTVSFLATRAGNVIRAGIGPDRIRDVVVLVPRLGPDDGRERIALARLTLADVRDAPHPFTGSFRFATTAFDPIDVDSGDGWIAVGPGVFLSADAPPPASAIGRAPDEPLVPAGTPEISIASLGALLLFGVAGYGWARAGSITGGAPALAVAPAFGWGAFAIVAIALERAGLPLTGSIGPAVVSAVALGGGHVLRLLLERRARTRSTAEVEE